MEYKQQRPLLTLHGPHPGGHSADSPAQQPQYMLRRRHSKTQCAVYLKHPRRQAAKP